jgi:hypothetical protein
MDHLKSHLSVRLLLLESGMGWGGYLLLFPRDATKGVGCCGVGPPRETSPSESKRGVSQDTQKISQTLNKIIRFPFVDFMILDPVGLLCNRTS